MSGTGRAGGQSPAGQVRQPSVPAEPPAAGFACLPSGALLLPRGRAVRPFVRFRLHGGVMKRARRSFESFAALAKAGAAPGSPMATGRTGYRARETGNRRHGFPAVPGRDNRPGGRRPRGTIVDGAAAHAP